MLVCFFSVQHFAAKNKEYISPLKVILLTIFSDKGVIAESLSCPNAFCVRLTFFSLISLMQYIDEFHLQATKTQLKFLCRQDSYGEIFWTLKKSFSSELKCLHYSNTNGRNDNIIIIIIIIIHLGLSPVQYNNKQNPFFKILLLETLLNVKCVYLHNLALYSFPFPLYSPSVSVSFSSLLCQLTALGHCRLSLFSRGIWGGKEKEISSNITISF